MERVKKEEAVELFKGLKAKGITPEEIAVYMGKSHQTIWAWGSPARPTRKPSKSEMEVLRRLLTEKK